jgi:hypothetical protein
MTQDQLTAEAQASTTVSNSTTFKAVIAGVASSIRTKSNGVDFVYIKATLLDGAAKGMTVLATRTVKNIKGEEKSIPVEGEEIIVYHTKLPSLKIEGEFVHFFEISTNTNQVADNNTLSSLL